MTLTFSQMNQLTRSLWIPHRARPLEDTDVFGENYIAVVPEHQSVICVFPIRLHSEDKIRIIAYGIWYEQLSEYEFRISMVTRSGYSWKEAIIRECEDYLQWFEPKESNNFNCFHTKDCWSNLRGEFLNQFERVLDRTIRYRP